MNTAPPAISDQCRRVLGGSRSSFVEISKIVGSMDVVAANVPSAEVNLSGSIDGGTGGSTTGSILHQPNSLCATSSWKNLTQIAPERSGRSSQSPTPGAVPPTTISKPPSSSNPMASLSMRAVASEPMPPVLL
ncbi:hypothetical protein MTX80_10900 [Gordonia amicalis]|nr:hypothetical protein [Gordonia amicalis]UOG23310.1 hypothetical protein MTX80_10900 [Gordonia amicalis]